MAILVVGGSTKDIGKTALVCAIISALREFEWTAVKITGHDYSAGAVNQDPSESAIQEESAAGEQTDTSRYLAAGARRALLVSRGGAEIPAEEIRRAVGADRNVIFESNRIVEIIKPDVCLALAANPQTEWKGSFHRLLEKADAVVSFGAIEIELGMQQDEVARFALRSAETLPAEMLTWLRERLNVEHAISL